MIYYTVKGVRRPVFWGLAILGVAVAITFLVGVYYCLSTAFGWKGVVSAIVLSIVVKVDGKEYRLIPVKVISDLVLFCLVLSAAIITIFGL